MLVHTTLLQLAIYDDMHTATIDTVGAYLYQEYPKTHKPLYLKLPKSVAMACDLDPNALYRVRKYLYGLPDSGRAYYNAYSQHLSDNGYSKSISDPCCFYKIKQEENLRTYIWFHVDDTFIASTNQNELTEFKNVVAKKFNITYNDDVTSHLGISIARSDHGIKLTQPKLMNDLFKEYPQDKGAKYPMQADRKDPNPIDFDPAQYSKLLGKLMYLANSRTDILTAISYAGTHAKNPTQRDYESLLDIVRYLYQTKDKGLILKRKQDRDESFNDLKLTCYVDAAYLSHPDAGSHTGYCISLGNSESFFHAKSNKQKLTATSSTHAECRALYDLTIKLVFLVNFLQEIGRPIQQPAIVFEDNQAIIDLTTNPDGKAAKSKHFLMMVNFIKEQVESGLINLRKISTHDNIANILTKAVVGTEFILGVEKLLGEYNHPELSALT
jgi:hypothetical protein